MRTTDQRLRPLHPVSQQTTAELAAYRAVLEAALALDTLPPLYAPREELQQRLDMVIQEQAERQRIRRGGLAMLRLCSCGLAMDDDAWFECHLIEHPRHRERVSVYLARTPLR